MSFTVNKKDFISRLKEYKNLRGAAKDFVEDDYNIVDGAVVIDIALNTKEDVYSPYSSCDNPVLSESLFDMIEKETYYIPAAAPLRLRFSGSVLKETDEENIRNLFRRRYELEFNDKSLDLKLSRTISAALFITGAVLYGVTFIVSRFGFSDFLTEFLGIMGSFAMWECVDYGWIVGSTNKINRLNVGQLLLAELEFIKEENKSEDKV